MELSSLQQFSVRFHAFRSAIEGRQPALQNERSLPRWLDAPHGVSVSPESRLYGC
jgi:hypothetical protein